MLKPALRDLLWLAAGALLFGAVVAGFTMAYDDRPAAEQLAERARKLELVDEMRVRLASASDAAQAAVVAVSDEQSQGFAAEARAASAALQAERQALAALLDREPERQRLADFDQAFAGLSTLHEELLDLAVRHTNLKAYALLYGPLAEALDALGTALAGLAPAGDPSAAEGVAVLALRTELAARRLQTLLPPHVAEERAERMDALEARMAEPEAEVRDGLQALHTLPLPPHELQAADDAWAQVVELREQVVSLSRENTNVRSLALSLDRKRQLVGACAAALDALRQVLVEEPLPGMPHGPPPRPR